MEYTPTTGRLRILACVALSPRLTALISEAIQLSRALSAEVVFLHVGEAAPAVPEAIGQVQAQYAPGEPMPPLLVEHGRPHEVICKTIRQSQADLVLIGAIERESLFTGVFGSVARRVVRSAECPVLVLTHPRVEGSRYRTIVLSTQYDALSSAMIRFILRFAHAVKTETIHVVHESHSVGRLMSQYEEAPLRELEERRRIRLTTERTRLTDFLAPFTFQPVSLVCEYLEEAEGLSAVEYTRTQEGDLLVYPMEARPLTWWDRFFNHPVENILEKLPAAVLLYRLRPDSGCNSEQGK